MISVVKISVKSFNASKLEEELAAAGLPVLSLQWFGFNPIDDWVYAPFPEATKIIGGFSLAGRNYSAQQGELWLIMTRSLTTQENTDLVALLAAHNPTALTAEQARQVQDESDLDALIASDRDAFIAALQSMQTGINGWDAATTADKLIIAKNFFTLTRANMIIIGKLMRLFIRRERGVAI